MNQKVHRRRIGLLLLPILVLLWMIGWSMFWVGMVEGAKPKRVQARSTSKEAQSE